MALRSGAITALVVDLVRFWRSASMAAFLMCSGVAKSGSPGPKSTTSTPRAFSFSPSMSTAMVGDTEIRFTRFASRTAVLLSRALVEPQRGLDGLEVFLRNYFDAQASFDFRRHQAGYRSAEARDLAHQARTQITVSFGGQHEHCFQTGLKAAVHHGHLQFVLVVGDGADAAEEHARFHAPRVFHEQTIEGIHFHVGEGLG